MQFSKKEFIKTVEHLKHLCDRVLQVCGKLSWAPEIRTEEILNDTSMDLYKTVFMHDIKFFDSSTGYDFIWWAADIIKYANDLEKMFDADDWSHYHVLKDKADNNYGYIKNWKEDDKTD